MGLFNNTVAFAWTNLESREQLTELFQRSETQPVVFFKHSTRCGTSRMALNRFEQEWTADENACTCVFLDLIRFRELSNAIADKTGVYHESPQAILLVKGKVVYQASHERINAEVIENLL